MKEVARIKTNYGDLVCFASPSKSYPGFYVFLICDGQSALISTTEIENDPDSQFASSIVCSYRPSDDDPNHVDTFPMQEYENYFKEV